MILIESLNLNPANPRVIKDEKFKKLVASLRSFPQMMDLRPIVVDENNVIQGGNMRYRALCELGYKEIPEAWVKQGKDLTPDQWREFVIKDNVGFGEWDFDTLANEWNADELQEWGLDLPVDFGGVPEAHEDDYEIPDEIETDIVVGDLFEIGPHRLLCGDSTNSDDVARLMNGEKAELLLTDPPYGIKADKGFGGFGGFGEPIKRRTYTDDWDSKRPEQNTFFLILETALSAVIFGGNFFADMLPTSKHWLVWDKLNTMPTFGDCELAWTNIERNSVKKYTVEYNGLIGKEKERSHPTQKPVKLFSVILTDYTKDNSLINDFYLGSGTTMVAAHQLNRKCYGMEIDPKYCQVIIDRMIKLDPTITITKNGEPYDTRKETNP